MKESKPYHYQKSLVEKAKQQSKKLFELLTSFIQRYKFFVIGGTVVFLLLATLGLAKYQSIIRFSEEKGGAIIQQEKSPEEGDTFPDIFPGETSLPSPIGPEAVPSSVQASAPPVVATPKPSPRVPNPPIINVSYPSQGQSIEMATSQQFCVVDSPSGGDTSGIQRRHKINDENWSSYQDIFTLCFDPQEGLNKISLQYKNSFGDESVVYARQFNFHRIEDINITISGQIYRDENCNGVRDGGEGNIAVTAQVTLFKMPEFSIYRQFNSESNGSFNFSSNIRGNESITLEPSVQSPSGYKSNPTFKAPSLTLNSGNRSVSVNYPQVPNENVGQCQF